eukprot:TRINITY_DN11562_c0_g1_i1.p1 TRINITY_DN11562_c0_g1~~TRINITY_DN11562_c0_g1_i1.p1  ORF type:complete len:396 (-),score=42.31 TRINITY_DN11562_c0_g1_i1:207-1394(-)
MCPTSRSQSQELQTFRRQGFDICCLMAGSGSLFCTCIGFPSPDGYVRTLFRVSSVGFCTFTVVGYSYGYESSSVVKRAAFHLALVFSSGGLGLCGAYWMNDVPRLLLLILSVFTCLFQAVCVNFQLEGSGLLLHILLTAILPGLASVGHGASNDVVNDSLSVILQQEARILQADDGESGETWAYLIIIAAVCVVVGTISLAVGKVWYRRHDLLRQEAQRVIEWHDVAIGKTLYRDHSSSPGAASSMEAAPDDGFSAVLSDVSFPGRLGSTDPGSSGDERAGSHTITSPPRSRPTVENLDEVADAGKAEDRAGLNVDQVDVQLLGSGELPATSDATHVGESLASMMQIFNASGSMNIDISAPETAQPHVDAFDGLEDLHDDVKCDLLTLSESSSNP